MNLMELNYDFRGAIKLQAKQDMLRVKQDAQKEALEHANDMRLRMQKDLYKRSRHR